MKEVSLEVSERTPMTHASDTESHSSAHQKLSFFDATAEQSEQLSIPAATGEASKASELHQSMSQISLFSPFDDCNEQTKTCMAPKLDAQTLFAFGVSYRKILLVFCSHSGLF